VDAQDKARNYRVDHVVIARAWLKLSPAALLPLRGFELLQDRLELLLSRPC
jgi:hypothetical protein